jgi:hypothetical protein
MLKSSTSELTFLLFMFIAIIFSGAVIKYTMPEMSVPHQSEGLENMQRQNFKLTPGGYPVTHDMLLLNPEYPKAFNDGAESGQGVAETSNKSSKAGAGPGPAWQFSTPDNGTCSPLLFCNTFYGERPLGEAGAGYSVPPPIPLTDGRRRVNFYASDDNNV